VQDVFAGRLFKTRGGAVLIGGVAAVLAAILLIVYLHSYRSSVNSGSQPMTVLVAKSLIPRGTSGSLIAQEGLYQVTTVTATDIFPGQQLTTTDFSAEGANSIPSVITGKNRAIAFSVDSPHSVAGQIAAGDHVDVYVGLSTNGGPIIKLLASNVLVLAAPTAGSGGVGGSSGNGSAVLRVTTTTAPKFAFAADNGILWLVLRPQVGANPTPPSQIDAAALLAGSPSVGG
jgi:Flp pilus assembly protein CpaB